MRPTITAVIPAYNAEAHIERCVRSLQLQTFGTLEIVVIDDGSTDNTGAIVRHLMRDDDRIKLIATENGGVSSARNSGLQAANGDYVTFVDADDWLDPNMLRPLAELAENGGFDIVAADLIVHTPKGMYIESHPLDGGAYSRQSMHERIFPNIISSDRLTRPWPYRAVAKLYRRKTLSDNGVTFVNGLRAAQDFVFAVEATLVAKDFYYLKGHGAYHYGWNDRSRTRTPLPRAWENYRAQDAEFVRIAARHPFLNEQLKFAELHGDLSSLTYMYRGLRVSEWQSSYRYMLAHLSRTDRSEAFESLAWRELSLGKRLVCAIYRFRHFRVIHLMMFARSQIHSASRRARTTEPIG
ncbi:glycosyltransferase family 2 protein [Janibacter terrae]|uniref:glycosyltransferase family 2 protein n=1 Tax=Janibacter terrae TaxID=103817 RepID=UPI0031F8FF0F